MDWTKIDMRLMELAPSLTPERIDRLTLSEIVVILESGDEDARGRPRDDLFAGLPARERLRLGVRR